jgi:hypothetical protein
MIYKFVHSAVALIATIFVIVYLCLLLPAFVYMPILGIITFSSHEMTTLGGIVCVLIMLTVPLSMGASLYFIIVSYSRKKYLNVLCFCLLPVICLFLGLLCMNFLTMLFSRTIA